VVVTSPPVVVPVATGRGDPSREHEVGVLPQRPSPRPVVAVEAHLVAGLYSGLREQLGDRRPHPPDRQVEQGHRVDESVGQRRTPGALGEQPVLPSLDPVHPTGQLAPLEVAQLLGRRGDHHPNRRPRYRSSASLWGR
jgi:hypothetical protein